MKTKIALLLALLTSLAVSVFLAYQNMQLRQQAVELAPANETVAQPESVVSESESKITTGTDKGPASPAAFGFGLGAGFRVVADSLGAASHFDYAFCEGFQDPVAIQFEAEQTENPSYGYTRGEIFDLQGFRYRLAGDHETPMEPNTECFFIRDERREEGMVFRMLYQSKRQVPLPQRTELKICEPDLLQIIQTEGFVPKDSVMMECRHQEFFNGFQQADVITSAQETCSYTTLFKIAGTWFKADVDSRKNPCADAESQSSWHVHELRNVFDLNHSTYVLANLYTEHGYDSRLFSLQGKTLKLLSDGGRQTIF